MSTRWTGWVAGCLVVATAGAWAQDKPAPAPDKLVVKARWKGPAVSSPDDAPLLLPMPFGGFGALAGLSVKTTIGDGAFESVITAKNLAVAGILEVSFPKGRANLFVLRDPLRGELDLGEISLGDTPPVLVAGRVLTESKKPAYGAKVIVHYRPSRDFSMSLSGLGAVTDATGAFTIRGDLRGFTSGLSVKTTGRWQSGRKYEFAVGAKDVEVVATETSSVHGTVEVPPGLPLADLVVVMKGPPHGTEGARVRDCDSARGGGTIDCLEFPARASFDVEGLVPGTYDVRLRFREASRALVRLPEVVLDETASDLPPLKYAGAVHHVAAGVVGPDGASAKGVRLWARDTGDRGNFRSIELDAASKADVAFVADEVELAARADGTGYALTTTSKEQVALALPPSPRSEISIVLPDGSPRTANDSDLLVVLTWLAPADVPAAAVDAVRDETDPRAAEKLEIPLPTSGAATRIVDVAGWYQIGFAVRRRNLSKLTMTRLGERVLVASAGTKSAPLGVGADDMAALLKEVEAR